MGRLTLNVLLSFAQFEREVTSERIRDKIAASKRKGLWVGGTLPLGYEMKEGKIAVVEEEAELVRSIFRRYLELGSVNEPVAVLLLFDLRERLSKQVIAKNKTGVLNLICIAGTDSNISAFNGESVCNRASNAARTPEHDSISSSQTQVHSYFLC
jgi:hypothetical protein